MQTIDFSSLHKRMAVLCPCCHVDATPVFALPDYPITEFFKPADDLSDLYGFFDQQVLFCAACNHMFLKNILDARQIYSHYLTVSVSSGGAVGCLESFSRFIEANVADLSPLSLIDIGGNDSTFLSYFVGKVSKLINIDANASTSTAEIELHKSFLEDVDFEAFNSHPARVFASSHTLEHLEEPVAFIEKLAASIREADCLFLQFPSLEMLVSQGRFDQICHQHLNYFSLESISIALRQNGLRIDAYEFDTAHFGTLRLKVSRGKPLDIATTRFSAAEVTTSFSRFQRYYAALNEMLTSVYRNGQGFGAGLMVPTLAYHLPLVNSLSRIVDENPARQRKRFINVQPPIVEIEALNRELPVLITAISTKEASRSIFRRLTSLGVRDICLPAAMV